MLGASLGLRGKPLEGMPAEVCHPWDQALPRAVSTLAQLNSTAVWSAAVKLLEIYLPHVFFFPRTEEVNRHLKRDSPGLIVQQFLARHFQWKTLDSEVFFQGSPEWVH